MALAFQIEREAKKIFNLKENEIICLAGASKKNRLKAYENAKIIISTPQGIFNDLKNNLLKWNFSLVVFDEVDFGVGDYQYVHIGKFAIKNKTQILGLSATTGHIEKLYDLVETFNFENISIKLDKEQDISPFRRKIDEISIFCNLDENYIKMNEIVNKLISSHISTLNYYGDFNLNEKFLSIQKINEISKATNNLPWSKDKKYIIDSLSSLYQLLELKRIINTESSQLIKKRIKYLININKDYSKNLLNSLKIHGFVLPLKNSTISEKILKFLEEIKKIKKSEEEQKNILKALVICESRAFAEFINSLLDSNGFKSKLYLGKNKNFKKNDQLKALKEFLDSDLEILVATRAAIERGIDLPNTDYVFLLSIPYNEKSFIQLRNRINRVFSSKVGKFFYFVNNSDEKKLYAIGKAKVEYYFNSLSNLKEKIQLNNSLLTKKDLLYLIQTCFKNNSKKS